MNSAHTQARPRRNAARGDWGLAALGGGCAIAGSACLLLAACSTNPGKPSSAQALPGSAIPSAPESLPTEHAATASASTDSAGTWTRLRQSFALNACDYNAQVTQWSRRFGHDPAGFTASLAQSMPFLLVVAGQIEKRGIPGEFAFLPYIESNYTALASSGDHAAGIWQLMPDTAREAGLSITADYDGRLDVYASTATALDLLEHYHEKFGDWRVADVAYNYGEYGIGDLPGSGDGVPSSAELARLRVPAHTHEHLAKLLAVSCLVAEPERFHVELPDPQAEDELALLDLPAAVDLALVARIAGIDLAQLKHFNPGYVRGHMPNGGPFRVLVPAARRDAVAAALDRVPRPLWVEWREITLQHDEDVAVLATAQGLEPDALRAINATGSDTLPAGTRVLVPGHAEATHIPAAIAKAEAIVERASTHVVHAGDTLWSIARSAGVRLADLLYWNGLHGDATLHLGQRLRLHAPDATASAGAAGAP